MTATPDNEAAPALAAFRDYVRRFEALEPHAIVGDYHEPAMLISPQGVVVLPNPGAVEQFFARVMGDLRGQGYAGSEFPRLAAHRLAEDRALVTGVGVWKKAGGGELRRFGLTYTLCRTAGAWRIACAVVHDPAGALSA